MCQQLIYNDIDFSIHRCCNSKYCFHCNFFTFEYNNEVYVINSAYDCLLPIKGIYTPTEIMDHSAWTADVCFVLTSLGFNLSEVKFKIL